MRPAHGPLSTRLSNVRIGATGTGATADIPILRRARPPRSLEALAPTVGVRGGRSAHPGADRGQVGWFLHWSMEP